MRRRRYVTLGSTEETTTPLAREECDSTFNLSRGACAEAPAFIEHLFELSVRVSARITIEEALRDCLPTLWGARGSGDKEPRNKTRRSAKGSESVDGAHKRSLRSVELRTPRALYPFASRI
jgi:hypothetical protein